MKKIGIFYAGVIALACSFKHAGAQVGNSFELVGLESRKVPVTINKMTSLVFPANIRKGIKVSREIAAEKVAGVENVIELKALRAHFVPTNLSVYGVDGRLYSFDLLYADDPAVLNFAVINDDAGHASRVAPLPGKITLSGLPTDEMTLERDADSLAALPGFLRHSTAGEKMRLRLTGFYLRDSLLWLTGSISDYSLIPYRPQYLRLFIVDRKRGKKMALQELTVEPLYDRLPADVRGRTTFAIGCPPFTIAGNKKLVLEMAESNGSRLLRLEIKCKTLLKARAR